MNAFIIYTLNRYLLILITFISLFVLLYLDTQTRIIKIHVVNIRILHVERFSQTGKSQDG